MNPDLPAAQAQGHQAQNPPLDPASARPQPAAPRKLDLSKVAPPANLESFELEEMTIDGICGVY